MKDKAANQRFFSPKTASVFLALTLSSVAFYWFYLLDRLPPELAARPAWDWGLYLQMAMQFNSLDEEPWKGVPSPWNNRTLLPWIWSLVEGNGVSFLHAATIVGIVGMAVYAVLLGCFLWRHIESKALWLTTFLLLLFMPSGAIRQTIAHPFSGIWLEGIAFISLALIWRNFKKSSANSAYKLLLIFPVIVLSSAREFFLYGLIFFLASGLIARAARVRGLWVSISGKVELSLNSIAWLSVYVICGFVTRLLLGTAFPASSESAIQPLLSALVSFYRWANWIDVLAAVFLAFGPVLLLYMLTESRNRINLQEQLLAPLILGLMFAFTGGTDLDRFLVWMAPIAAAQFLGGRRFTLDRWKNFAVMTFTTICLIVSMRPLLPAVPSYSIATSSNCGSYPVVDYSSDRAKGLLFDRSDLKFADDATLDQFSVYPRDSEVLPGDLESCGKTFNSGPGKGLDNIPVALGFINNQYSLLTIHPFHGDWKSRTPFVIEWLLVLALIWTLRLGPLRISMPRFWFPQRRR